MGRGEEQRAFALVEAASARGDVDAIDYLAWFYEKGRFVAAGSPARGLYRRAAERGSGMRNGGSA